MQVRVLSRSEGNFYLFNHVNIQVTLTSLVLVTIAKPIVNLSPDDTRLKVIVHDTWKTVSPQSILLSWLISFYITMLPPASYTP